MLIRCWGSRGSIPVSGESYLRYGGDTTCLEIRARSGAIIVVDAGTGIRRCGNHLDREAHLEYHLIFTHAHWDHIMGFPFFKPLHTANSHIHLHGCPFDAQYVKKILSQVMGEPHFPVAYADIRARISYEPFCPQTFDIGSVTVEPIPISHPNGGSGYRFTENGKSFVFLTDNELGFRHPGGLRFSEYVARVDGADLLIHDAEYTPREYRRFKQWGHSVYTDALRLASEAGCKMLGLFHLNQERTDVEMDRIVAECKKIMPPAGDPVDCFGVSGHWQMEL